MPGYDESKDIEMVHIGSVQLTQTTQIHIAVRSYDGDEPRLSITKEVRGFVTAKLGRFTPEQAREVAGLMTAGASWIEAYLSAAA